MPGQRLVSLVFCQDAKTLLRSELHAAQRLLSSRPPSVSSAPILRRWYPKVCRECYSVYR